MLSYVNILKKETLFLCFYYKTIVILFLPWHRVSHSILSPFYLVYVLRKFRCDNNVITWTRPTTTLRIYTFLLPAGPVRHHCTGPRTKINWSIVLWRRWHQLASFWLRSTYMCIYVFFLLNVYFYSPFTTEITRQTNDFFSSLLAQKNTTIRSLMVVPKSITIFSFVFF